MVTMKTVSNLSSEASKLSAIADYLYENGMKAEADQLMLVSASTSQIAHSIQEKIIKYNHAVMKDE